MRKWLLLSLLLLAPSAAHAQYTGDLELSVLGGWQYGGTQPVYNYIGYEAAELHANANWNFGGALTYYAKDYYGFELQYSYQASDLMLRPTGLSDTTLSALQTHYMHCYGMAVTPLGSERAEGFVLGGLGATVYTTDVYEDRWLFSLGGGGGVRLRMSDRVMLRLQGRILVPLQFSSGGVYFGSSGGTITVGGGSAIVQGDVSAGITVQLAGRR